jgi:acetyltransferase-like isoleucine patch superfamily enzyme
MDHQRVRRAAIRVAGGASSINMHARVRPHRFGSFGSKSHICAPLTVVGSPDSIHVGDNVHLGPNATLSAVREHHGQSYDPLVTIGDGCSFGEQLFISCCGAVSIGREVMASARVVLTDNYHAYEDPSVAPIHQPLSEPNPVRVGDGAFLGVGCVVLPGVTLGVRAYVGANAVVTKDVPPWTIVAGNPARAIRQWNGNEWTRTSSGSEDLCHQTDAPPRLFGG